MYVILYIQNWKEECVFTAHTLIKKYACYIRKIVNY